MAQGEISNWGLPTMEAAEALEAYDLVYVSAAGKVSKTTAGTDYAVGVVLRAYALGDKEVSVVPLGKGTTLAMRASGIIGVGLPVMAAADGECALYAATVNTENVEDARVLGVALVAAGAANDIIEVFCF